MKNEVCMCFTYGFHLFTTYFNFLYTLIGKKKKSHSNLTLFSFSSSLLIYFSIYPLFPSLTNIQTRTNNLNTYLYYDGYKLTQPLTLQLRHPISPSASSHHLHPLPCLLPFPFFLRLPLSHSLTFPLSFPVSPYSISLFL